MLLILALHIYILLLLLFIEIPAEKLHSHPNKILATRIFDSWQESWPDLQQDHTEILATETFASRGKSWQASQ